MAQRRMFSLKVVDTDEFLDMPPTTQNLYFHLGMRTDDEGFVASPKKIMKIVNSANDDMKVLVAKKFVIPFKSGICVITHWNIHNSIQSDRFSETRYLEEKAELDKNNGMYTKCIQNVSSLYTQVRLGKVRLGKDNLYGQNFLKFWKEYPNKVAKQQALRAWKALSIDETLFTTILEAVSNFKKSSAWTKDNGQFVPHPATFLNGRRWEDEIKEDEVIKTHKF